jgi:hypothetical protein
MSKSIDSLLKQLLDSQAEQAKALETKLSAMASEGNTYTERMKQMEENLTQAMKKVLEMDNNIKDYHKDVGGKVEALDKKYCALFNIDPSLKGVIAPQDKGITPNAGEKMEDKKEEPAVDKSEKDGESPVMEKKDEEKNDKAEEMKEPMSEKKKAQEGEEMDDEEGEDEEAKAENSLGGINKNLQTVDSKSNLKRHRERPMGKGKDDKISVTGAPAIAQETTPEAVAKEVVAKPVASEQSASASVEALNAKIEAAIQKLASLTAPKPVASEDEITSVKNALALESKAKEEAISQMKALNEKFESLMAKVSTIEKSASTVEAKAAQIVASSGVEAVAISVDQTPVVETEEDVYKKFEALTGVEQRKFYLANKATIERHASSILRAKRS